MKALIIGGTGYIGSALFRYLSPRHDVDTVDTEWFGNFVNPKNIRLNYSDISVKQLEKYDAIVLLAGHSSVQMCEGNTFSSFKNNCLNFVEFLQKVNDKQAFIYASSSSVYGQIGSVEATETFREFIPNNPYDLSKSVIDHYAQLSDLNYYGLRFGTVNGFSENFRADIMINSMSLAAIREKKVFVSAPGICRPILGIKDLCRAVEAIINKNKPELRGIYNLSSFNTSVLKAGEVAANTLGAELIVKEGASNYSFYMSTQKFCENFEFTFRQTIKSIVEDIAENKGRILPSKRNVKL